MQRPPAQMDLPDIIAATWGACLRHWRLLLRLALAGALISAAVNLALLRAAPVLPEGETATPEQARRFIADASPLITLAVVAGLFTHLALVRAALDILRGQPVSAATALGAGLRAMPAAAVSALIVLLVAAFLLATVILTPLALYLFVGWLFSTQLVVDERAGPFAALGRSRRLVRGQWWRTCAIGMAVLVLYAFPGIIFARIGAAFGADIAASAGAGLASMVAAPFLALGHTQLYLEIRRRKGEPLRPVPPAEHASL